MRQIGAHEVDIAVVAIGTGIEARLLSTGVPHSRSKRAQLIGDGAATIHPSIAFLPSCPIS